MADIFHEVDEEVRRDKALEFWKRHQNLLIALAVLVIAAAGGWRWWQDSRRAAAEAAGARFEAATQLLRDGKTTEGDEALQGVIAGASPGYALLARFRAAGALAARDPAKAETTYDSLANDASIDPGLRDLARLRSAILRVDTDSYADVLKRLEPLAATGAPYRNTAREFLAMSAFKANDGDAAGKWLDAIVVDQDSTPDQRSRAEALLGLVGPAKPKG